MPEPSRDDNLSLTRHFRATLAFGLPLAGANLAGLAINVTDTVMVGWLGATQLAAVVLASQFYFLMWIIGAGMAFAVIPLASNALGAGDTAKVRRSVRMGLWLLTLYSAAAMVPLWFAEEIFLALGQPPEIAGLAGIYTRVAVWALLPATLLAGLRAFLMSLQCARFILGATISGALLNVLLNYMFIFGNFGAPRMEIAGAALATVGANAFIAAAMAAYIIVQPNTREFKIFNRIWRPDWELLLEILRLGWPISVGLLAEMGLFMAATIMMGWLGTVALAAHGIVMQLVAVAFMVPLGLANAATVRVGVAFGRFDWHALGRAGIIVFIAAGSMSVTIAAIYLVFPGFLITRFLDMGNAKSAEILNYAIPLLLIASIFHIFDGVQAVGLGVLRGMKDTRVPMYIAVFSYWLIGVPAAYLFAFTFGMGGIGVWIGITIGLVVAAAALLHRFVRRDQLSHLAK